MDELTPFDIVMAASDRATERAQKNKWLTEAKPAEDRQKIYAVAFWVFMAVATIVLS